MGILGPVLRSHAPGRLGVTVVLDKLWYAVVLSIEEDDVHSQTVPESLRLQQSGDLQQHPHPGSAVIGSVDRGVPLGRIALRIGIGAGVPVGKEKDSLPGLGSILTDDIDALKPSAVVGGQRHRLLDHIETMPTQLLREEGRALLMRLAPRDTGTKGDLASYIGVGRVGREGRLHHRPGLSLGCRLTSALLLPAT